jgi:hypothetical protein
MKEEEVCPMGDMIELLSLQPRDAFFKPAVDGLEGCAFSLRDHLRDLGFEANCAIGDSKPQMCNQPFAQRFFSGTFTPACERLRPMARVTQRLTTFCPLLPAWRKLEV